MSSLVQHGLIQRGRIFTFAVQLPDRPGSLLAVAQILADNNGPRGFLPPRRLQWWWRQEG